MPSGRISAGSNEPLGASLTPSGVNFAVFSSAATAIDLCLFDADERETRLRLPGRTGGVFHGHVQGLKAGARYGLRAHGPYSPAAGLRFDPTKLLVDPYAALLDRPLALDPALFAPPTALTDSAPFVPKAVVAAHAPAAPPPRIIPWDETVIYEAHVKGLTRLHPDVPEYLRGTFAALAHPAIVEHLKALGVTTIELLPVAAWVDERHLPPLGLNNYWGYNPVVFGAPDPRLAPGGWDEVRTATAALAAAGIETVLDLVFNHTGEGDALGPTLSLRGLDNAYYYRLHPDDPARYVDDSGTGDTLACDRPEVVRLVMESMRTWVRRGGVAGFRFDLATVLGRRPGGFDPEAPLLTAIAQDPELRDLKLIAEPWDCGPGGHQLGRFPAPWGEWNDRYRDAVRRFWKPGGGGTLGEVAGRLAGSADAFGARNRPSRSVNFVVAHDGFTLADLVAFEAKRNEANGEENRDGTDNNNSWNNGVEGPTMDPGIAASRLADQRALLATLMLSRGTPMLAMGAELGQTQGGNNNAYAQDNATSWIDWARADRLLAAFAGELARARREHPALRADAFLTGEATRIPWPDVEWLDAAGLPMSPAGWDDPASSTLQMALAAPAGDGTVDRVVVAIHRGERSAEAVLPAAQDGRRWSVLLDSADDLRRGPLQAGTAMLHPRSVLLIAEEPRPGPPHAADDAEVGRLARAAGIAPDWWGIDGGRRAVSVETERAILAAMGLPAATAGDVREGLWRLSAGTRAILPPCRVIREGETPRLPVRSGDAWLVVEDEAGALKPVAVEHGEAQLPILPVGRYRLRAGDAEGALIVAPPATFEPPALASGERLFGLSVQLYALQRAGDQGVGDFTSLARLGEAAGPMGARLIALNPLHVLFPGDRSRASPYHPSDRRFLDPLYLDLATVPGAGAPASPLPAGDLIDYPAVWAAKAQALERATAWIAANAYERAAFDAFTAEGGAALTGFCTFQAIAEAHPGTPWTRWPEALRDPRSAEVAAFAAAHEGRVRHHRILQWLCDRQLGEAAAKAPGIGLCRDLAVGAAPDGAEAWASAGRLAMAASIGAPPDAFAPKGQVWALPPPIPHAWREEAYQGFAGLLRANLRHAGALRIDHVLGLSRLFWVPEGAEGSDGAYVAQPMDDLLAVLALESARAGALVIGEDLGTVPDGLREALAAERVYRYSVLPFERDGTRFRPPAAYPERALACVSTHDLPPLAGWWDGADVEERASLALVDADAATEARAARRADKAALLAALDEAGLGGDWTPDSPFDPALAAAIHAFAAAAESRLLAVQVEDLAAERVGVNLPGTDRERPNWRRRISLPVERLAEGEYARAILAKLRETRPSR